MTFFTYYALFLLKILTCLIGIASIVAMILKKKSAFKGLKITNLNKHYQELANTLNREILSKKEYKQYRKKQKQLLKSSTEKKRVVVLDFIGDINASATSNLKEIVTAILQMDTPIDEVIIRLESAGGLVPHYGLAASQLTRLRENNIRLVISVDKIAASGGYLMACVADEIIAAPFAMIGSIGVVTQFPNFNRLLKNNYIDFELLYAGDTKRTLTMFGDNTDQDREKMQSQLDAIHNAFKDFIRLHRKTVALNKVANGNHWLASQAIEFNLVDRLISSDDYLLQISRQASIYHLSYPLPKASFRERVGLELNAFSNQHWHHRLINRILFK